MDKQTEQKDFEKLLHTLIGKTVTVITERIGSDGLLLWVSLGRLEKGHNTYKVTCTATTFVNFSLESVKDVFCLDSDMPCIEVG